MSLSSDFAWASTNPGTCTFEYPAASSLNAARFDSAPAHAELEAQRQGEMQRVLQQAREQGQHEGESQARKVFEESLQVERAAMRDALQKFDQERRQYFHRVETEVVQLSLSIARKVLHREAQLDPGLLAGIVRVAMDRLAESTGVTIRVHPSHTEEWRAFFSTGDAATRPEIVGDGTVAPTSCTVSTQLGTTEFGLESQLKEIENGLFDLLAQRPGA